MTKPIQKVDILAIGAHPDDVELSCSGTLLKHIAQGKKVALVDLTQGELGTRGSAELRLQEAEASCRLMGAVDRINLNLGDGFFNQKQDNILAVVHAIRQFQPEVILANALDDRHPDHGRGATLVSRAAFLSGLRKIITDGLPAWRPKAVYHYIQDEHLQPDFVVDISNFLEGKMDLIGCFPSQFYDPKSTEPESPISGADFLDYIKAKGKLFGRSIGVEYAEGFNVARPMGIEDITTLL